MVTFKPVCHSVVALHTAALEIGLHNTDIQRDMPVHAFWRNEIHETLWVWKEHTNKFGSKIGIS